MNKISIKSGEVEISLEGDAKFVEKHLKDLRAKFFSTNEPAQAVGALKPVKLEKNQNFGDLVSFYQEKQPSTHYDKIAVIGYYLMEKEKKEIFTEEDIKNNYLELRKITKVPGNLKATLNDTIRYTNFIKRVKDEHFQLTSTGLNYVNHQLPAGAKGSKK